MPSLREIVDQRIVGAVGKVVEVLHADDFGDAAPLRDLGGRDVAQADVADQALPLELGEHGQRCLDRALPGTVAVPHDAQIDDVEHVEAQVAQIVVHRLRSVLGARWPDARRRRRRARRPPS